MAKADKEEDKKESKKEVKDAKEGREVIVPKEDDKKITDIPGIGPGIAAKLEAKVGVPVAAGMTCEVEALKHMGLKKVVVASPYPDNLTNRVSDFLTASGFQVLKAEGLGIELNSELANQPDHAAYRIARKVYFSAPDADGIFLPCNRWPTVSTIDLLERETGKAALSSTLCNIWYALYRLHIKEDIRGYGSLLASLR